MASGLLSVSGPACNGADLPRWNSFLIRRFGMLHDGSAHKVSATVRTREIVMTTADDRLDQWLRDAHAMEEQAEQMLSGLVQRIENYPSLKSRVENHLEQTRSQAQRVRSCIERRGASTSSLKDAAAKFTATMQSLSGVFAGDEIVKGTLASYTFEHMEIVSYRILMEAAKVVGDAETERVCSEIMEEEQAMADWLLQNCQEVTRQYLLREEEDLAEAKR